MIKVDVEGYEYDLLKGAFKILEHGNVKLIIEIHPDALRNYKKTTGEVLELLNLGKYNVWIQRNDNIPPIPYANERIDSRVNLYMLPKGGN